MNKRRYILILSFLYFFIFNCFTFLRAQTFERVETIVGLGMSEKNNGVAVADYDGDLDLDIFVVAKKIDTNLDSDSKSRLFRNNSNGTFTDVTEESGLTNLLAEEVVVHPGLDGYKIGIAWGDYDNDGFPDIFFTHSEKVQLFHNEGDGTFVDVTFISGIIADNNCANTGATWFDANNDSFLDLYISDWETCNSNSFYLNNGDGTFTDVGQQFFGTIPRKPSFMGIPFDFNSDGWMDLYVSQDFNYNNDVFINQGGMGFVSDSRTYGLGYASNDMGVTIGDYNNDGFFDFYIATISLNPLFKNKGDNTFENVARENNVLDTGWAWGPIFADFDLDGDEDIFVTNGFKFSEPKQDENYYLKNLYLEGQNRFSNISEDLGVNDLATSVTPVAFDYDNDGDLDLFVTNSDKESHFYENKIIDTSDNLNWFQVKLQGTTSNRDAIGASVSITTENGRIHRYNSSITHLSQSLKPLHFGIGAATNIQEVIIKWPSGLTETYNNFTSNSSILFTEGVGFMDYNIPEVIKKEGCTDPNSCTYDPEAIIDNGSCEYLNSNEITGNANSGFLNEETYTYSSVSQNSTFSWTVTGGEILDGFGTSSVTVKWGIGSTGQISVIETNEECSNQTVSYQVGLSAALRLDKYSIARLWNEALLMAIRGDFARPTVHARNLFHTSIALYDSWAVLDDTAKTYLLGNEVQGFTNTFSGFTPTESIDESRAKTMSYAAYRLLSHRFENSPSASETQGLLNFLMDELNYDIGNDGLDFSDGDAASLGNFIAKTIIDYGKVDGAREEDEYSNAFYEPVNRALFPQNPGNSRLTDPNRWQPLSLNEFIDQSGNLIQNSRPDFLSPEWGGVNPFSLTEETKTVFQRDGNEYEVYHDQGAPPYLNLNTNDVSSEAYKWGFSAVSIWSSHLDPADNVLWDISPNSIGNIDFMDLPRNTEQYPNFYSLIDGGDIGQGHSINPSTNLPYEEQIVPRGDYTRVLAEFWADGPDSETPPGHWFTIFNYVSDNEILQKRLNGEGEILDPLEWDVKSYFILGGAMHDAAISAWSLKGWYDYIRPISAIRYMARLGQSTNTSEDNYNVAGIPLREGFVEIVQMGDELSGRDNQHVGKIKLFTWRGPSFINDPSTDSAGVGWILAENWWPYQRPNFVTPPFAGYVSGHSTYSRAAAEVMTLLTGDAFFPGGFGEFIARKNEFLVFEEGPSVDIKLQWATYRDASDQCSLSRIWGGIHPPADDIPGRLIGELVGVQAFNFGVEYFDGKKTEEEPIVKENLGYVVFPNPMVSENISVANTSEEDTFALVDMLGRITTLNNKQFNESTKITTLTYPLNLASGVYALKINEDVKLILKR